MNRTTARNLMRIGWLVGGVLFWSCSLDTSGTSLFPGTGVGTGAGTTTGTGAGTTTGTGAGTTTGTGAGTTTGTGAGTTTGTASGGQGGFGGGLAGFGGAGGAGGAVGGSGGQAGGITDPTDLSGLRLWMRADLGVTELGGLVSGWADQSGHGNDASAPTPIAQPLLVPAALNGQPAILFDGVDDTLVVADAPGLDPNNASFLYVAVGRWLSGGSTYKVWFAKSSNVDAANYRMFRQSANRLQLFWGTDAEAYPPGSAMVADGIDQVMGWGLDVITNEVLYVVGGDVQRIGVTVSGTGNNALPATMAMDGARSYVASVGVAEQVFYRRPGAGFSNADLAALSGYLRAKYGL